MATNYKKWDNFAKDLSDSDDEKDSKPRPQIIQQPVQKKPAQNPKPAPPAAPVPVKKDPKEAAKEEESMLAAQIKAQNKKYEKRKKVTYQGRTVYEWEQSLEEVDIFITPPPGVKTRDIVCNISANHVKVGLKGAPLFMDEKLGGTCIKSESFWMFEDGVLHINLQKSKCGEAWMGATQHRGQQLSPLEQQELKQNILLERFQREHPGFDFSGAKFNGAAPNARNFMGGINTGELNRNVSFN